MKTYQSDYELIVDEILKQTSGRQRLNSDVQKNVISTRRQDFSEEISLMQELMIYNAQLRNIADNIASVKEVIQYMDQYITSGLDVTVVDSNTVKVSAGYGVAYGRIQSLAYDQEVAITFDDDTPVFYLQVKDGTVLVNKYDDGTILTVGKIIVPYPGKTTAVQDDKPTEPYGTAAGYNGWVESAKDAYFGEDTTFDDASREKIRDALSEIAGEVIFGTIRASESLTITNVHGTVQLTSQAMEFRDANKQVLAHYGGDYARIGGIALYSTYIQSTNYVSGQSGFHINSSGHVEFGDAVIRGGIYATYGRIGGIEITAHTVESLNFERGVSGFQWNDDGSIYANSGVLGGFTFDFYKLYGGTIQTGAYVAAGADGVVMDSDGLRGYNSVLGLVFNLPTDGSAPTFSSGVINETVFEISTNAIIRTSETVGDGTANSAGILINNTGIYGCEANQSLSEANLKALIDGTIAIKGEIVAYSGQIGSVTIDTDKLSGGLIEGSTIRSPVIESSSTTPRIRIDANGMYYQVTTLTGKYGQFKYGDGTKYGAGVMAFFMNTNYPILAIMAEQNLADIRLYNRGADPAAGTHEIGDLIVVNGSLKICSGAGAPGIFTTLLTSISAFSLDDLANTSLADPGADRIVFWDDSDNEYEFLIPGDGIEISANTLQIDYNATNLKITGVELDTIQSIATGASPTFAGLTLNGNLDFNDNQAIDFILENRTDDTGMTMTGQMWFRTDV